MHPCWMDDEGELRKGYDDGSPLFLPEPYASCLPGNVEAAFQRVDKENFDNSGYDKRELVDEIRRNKPQRAVESKWMNAPRIVAGSSPQDVPQSEEHSGLTEANLAALSEASQGKGNGKGKGKEESRFTGCDSIATNVPMAGSFAPHAAPPCMTFQADALGAGRRGSFAAQRSDASFAKGLPASAAGGDPRAIPSTEPPAGRNSNTRPPYVMNGPSRGSVSTSTPKGVSTTAPRLFGHVDKGGAGRS